MGQKYKDDKIGTLSHSAGIITLTASRVTIGGQQYSTGSLQHTLGSMTHNTLYMIYVVLNAGVLTLTKSTNVNSVGPAGFTSWKLVGAMYSDGGAPTLSSPSQVAAAFGGFVNIRGTPISPTINSYFQLNSLTGAAPSKATVRIYDSMNWKRVGSRILLYYRYRHDNNTGTGAGTGDYLYGYPTNLPFVIGVGTTIPFTGEGGANHQAIGSVFGATVNETVNVRGYYDNAISVEPKHGFVLNNTTFTASQSATRNAYTSSQLVLQFHAQADVAGWSDTPLEDL